MAVFYKTELNIVNYDHQKEELSVMRKRYLAGVLAAVMAMGLTACGGASTPTTAETKAEAKTEAKAEPAGEQSGEENKKEAKTTGGKLVVYSPNSEGIMNNVIPGFEEKYGIEVEVISAGAGELIKRLSSEANDPYADIDFGGVNYAIYKQNPDLFEEYVSPNDKNLPEEFQNTTGFYTNYTINGSCLLVNKDLIGDIKIESYDDLLNPELKGKIATCDPATSSSAFAQLTNILLAKGGYDSDEAWDFVGKLIEQWDGKVLSGSSAVYKGVADGEYTVGLTYEDPCATLVADGAPVEIVFPSEGAVYLPSGAAIIKGAKNMDNAKLFIDYLISDEVQQQFGDNLTIRPIIASISSKTLTPIGEIHTITEDIAYIAEHKNEIVERYKDLFASLQ